MIKSVVALPTVKTRRRMVGAGSLSIEAKQLQFKKKVTKILASGIIEFIKILQYGVFKKDIEDTYHRNYGALALWLYKVYKVYKLYKVVAELGPEPYFLWTIGQNHDRFKSNTTTITEYYVKLQSPLWHTQII